MTERPALDAAVKQLSEEHRAPVSLFWLLAVLLRERKTVLAFTAAGVVISLAVALLRQKTYTTAFSFVPQTAQEPSRAGLASLAGQFGISLGIGSVGGLSESPQFYADLLFTRDVLSPIATDSFTVDGGAGKRVALARFLDAAGSEAPVVLENTVRLLRRDVIAATVAARTTGMVTVRVRTESPHISLQIAERLLEGLNHFNLVTRQSQAHEERIFTEGRLEAARSSLRAAEDALQRFLQANREFAGSPALTFERDRLQRDVLLQQQVTTSLAQQYEENRIREVRDTPVITIIEHPTLAARPDPRLRALILLLGTFAAFSIAVMTVLVRDTLARERRSGIDPAFGVLASEWRRIRGARGS